MGVRQNGRMKTRLIANVGCWLLIFPLVAAAILYAFWIWHIWGGFYDGESYTQPVEMILDFLTPVAFLGVIGFAVLWRYGLAARSRAILAAAISLCFTLAPFIFCLWLCHKWNIYHPLSNWAWWLRPLGLVGL